MTKDKGDVAEGYIVESLRAGHLLSITEINESDDLEFGEGPVYTHFGGIGGLQYKALVEALSWTRQDLDDILDEHGLSREDVRRQRP